MPSPAQVRYAGFAGSLLLAVSAYLGGANRPWAPTITPGTIVAGDDGVLLPVSWLAGITLLIWAWWAGRRVVPSARWAYLTAGLWVLPLLPFLPLGSYDVYSYACQGWQQSAGLDPYAGGVDLLGCPWADAVAPTWTDSPAPYGPVFLLLAGLAAKVGGGSLTATVAGLRIVAVLGVLLIAVSLPALTRHTGVPLKRAVWLALACPLVPIHLVSGAHNDAVMVGLILAGLALAAARRPLLAGVLFGLAIGVKATAVVVVPFAVLLVFAPRKWRPAAALLGGVVAALAVVSLVSGRGFGWITGLTGSGVSVQWTSPPTAVGMTIGLFGINAVPVTRVAGIVLLAAVLVWLWWRALRGGDVWRNTGLAMAATVVLSPVFHPWYLTWALALLAVTVREETRWLVAPAAVASALCLPDGYNLALAVKTQGAVAMTVLLGYLGFKAIHAVKSSDPQPAGPGHAGDQLSRRDP
ncbi:alpha-1,6-mannosyltransferase [Actinoplanes tereljensis]|uniref:Membrane protein n=1 Tax=Paractinoplanes tereljensis TaxID=571912 RepID=A0A919NM35_9ACTN|nr:polyprenol phosphomannose-dependent alpha 1,6 mannosyltransferase MptB [Actinoplanes tereljensis]GIF21023.1 membrane protein [Actinoplanes tereljensis]